MAKRNDIPDAPRGPERVTVQLQYPITIGDETISELTLRRPRAGDMRELTMRKDGEMSADDMLTLIGRLSGQVSRVVDMIDLEDLEEVGRTVEGFLPASRPTGKTR